MITTDKLYKQYYSELYRFGCRLCGSDDEAKDLVQDAFMKLYLAQEKGDNIKNTRSWLYTVLYNSFSSSFKRLKKFNDIATEKAYSEDIETDLSEEIEEREKYEIVRREIQLLKKEDKSILLLYGEGLSYREIAEIMNIGQSYVGSYILRARKRLIKQLKKKYNELF